MILYHMMQNAILKHEISIWWNTFVYYYTHIQQPHSHIKLPSFLHNDIARILVCNTLGSFQWQSEEALTLFFRFSEVEDTKRDI